jgi:sugar lactone lactonase YvrE
MATDRHNHLYVADRQDNRIVKLSATGRLVATFGRYGTGSVIGAGPQFNMPSGIALDTLGRLYVADTGNDRIEVLQPNGRLIRIIRLQSTPVNMAVDRHFNIYCAEYYAYRVVKMSPRGRVVWSTDGTV